MAIAFHPDFRNNRRYFLKHEVMENNERFTTVVERRASEDFRTDAGTPSRRLLSVRQPAENHNGGTIAFGPDGYLYVAMGDGGPQEDPNGYSQDRREFLGGLARIDIDRRDDGKPYGIPPTNPWVGLPDEEALPELWATGLREPWRFSFDTLTGDLWIGDVGQARFEKVMIVRAGENHGWNVYEGFLPFSARHRRDGETYTPPVFAYERKHGTSVTGGHVYRGDRESSYYGVYIFGDFESRRVFALDQKDRLLVRVFEICRSPQKIASFGVDRAGEIYLVGYEGTIFRIDLSQSSFR
jgi:glucose/arabinose dehydrogenase